MRVKKNRGLSKPTDEWEYLADSSPKDKPWDTHRAEASQVGELLLSPGTERWIYKQGKRVEACSPSLGFGLSADLDTGEAKLKLLTAKFCRVKHCPVCQWRRSLMWKARFYSSLPQVLEIYPKAEWVFLTLTVRNCEIGDLKSQLQALNKAWNRFTQRTTFAGVDGWIRSTEITKGRDGTAHPHFHVLLMVGPSYFKKNYTSKAAWAEAWKTCARLDYDPVVDVRKVRAKKADIDRHGSKVGALAAAAAEVLKYTVKPSDLLSDREWFLELVRQTFRSRAIATGGALKEVLRQDQETDEDFIHTEEAPKSDELALLFFDFAVAVGRYRRKRTGSSC